MIAEKPPRRLAIGAGAIGAGAGRRRRSGPSRGQADFDRLRLRAAERLVLPAALSRRAGRGQGSGRQAQLHSDRRSRHRGLVGPHDAGRHRAEARRHRRRRLRHQRRRSLHQAGGRGRHSGLCQPVGPGPVGGRRRLRLRRPAGPGSRHRSPRRPARQGGRKNILCVINVPGNPYLAGDLQGPRREGQGARHHDRPTSNCRPPIRPIRPRSAATSAPICSPTRTSTASSPRTPRSAPRPPPRSMPPNSPARSMSATMEISARRAQQIKNGKIEFLINEQPYLDGYYGVLFATSTPSTALRRSARSSPARASSTRPTSTRSSRSSTPIPNVIGSK